MTTEDRGERRVALAAVAGAHGVKGEVRLKLFSDSVESLSRQKKRLHGAVERRLLSFATAAKVRSPASRGRRPIGRRGSCAGPWSKSTAPRCRRSRRANITTPTSSACQPSTVMGAAVGTVNAVENYGAGDLLEIEREDGKRR